MKRFRVIATPEVLTGIRDALHIHARASLNAERWIRQLYAQTCSCNFPSAALTRERKYLEEDLRQFLLRG